MKERIFINCCYSPRIYFLVFYVPVLVTEMISWSTSISIIHSPQLTPSLFSVKRRVSSLNKRIILFSSDTASFPGNENKDESEQQTAPNFSLHGNNGLPEYSMASVNLSQKWFHLVKDGQVSATTTIQEGDDNDDDDDVLVRYGVRLDEKQDGDKDNGTIIRYLDFVEYENSNETHARVERIRSALQQHQHQQQTSKDEPNSSDGIKQFHDGMFAAQLQLVRTLRPPPSEGFSGAVAAAADNDEDEKVSCIPPDYNDETDSFVTGPLKLTNRPLIDTVNLEHMHTPWDIYHNVSPADSRGHFLLLPTLSQKSNWRNQMLTDKDCHDLLHLSSTVSPPGSLLLCYNSFHAGASQNHVHVHAWPCPPLALLDQNHVVVGGEEEEEEEEERDGWFCYPVSKLGSMFDFFDLFDGGVEVSFLDYPVMCIELSSSSSLSATVNKYSLLSKALSVLLQTIGDIPHNICVLNRPSSTDDNGDDTNTNDDEDDDDVDVYVFIRSKEKSPNVVPQHKLGASEMMGVFHCRNEEELQELAADAALDSEKEEEEEEETSPMARALRDVSYEPRWDMWEQIKESLLGLDDDDDDDKKPDVYERTTI